MEQATLYEQISTRTGGDIYIGVVGPVRTGKSTFIKRFMETMVIPDMENEYRRERAKDELPQSGTGRTIMTAEPKFVPEDAAELHLPSGGTCHLRLVDCVGFMVEGALGDMEEQQPRLVSTPWRKEPMKLSEAAETGTQKVIADHSTIGLVITTDGSFSEIPRENYIPAEQRAIQELQKIGKPFLVLVNSAQPEDTAAQAVCQEIGERFGIVPIAVNCLTIGATDMASVLERVLYEFPVQQVAFSLPRYISALPQEHPVRQGILQSIRQAVSDDIRMRDLPEACTVLEQNENLSSAVVEQMELGTGRASLVLTVPEKTFYSVVSEQTGLPVSGAAEMIRVLRELSGVQKKYERIAGALEQVYRTGYGIVMPGLDDLSLEPPEIVRQGGRYGVRLRASATSVHLIRACIKAEVNPIVGTEKQSEELVHYLLSEFEEQPEKIWETNIFGKSLHELVREELSHKLSRMPEDARGKLCEALEKIINENASGLICIIL